MNTDLCIGPPQLGTIFFCSSAVYSWGGLEVGWKILMWLVEKKKKSCEDFLKKAEELLIRYYNHL